MNGYLYDLHTHTSETSKCGHLPAANVVDTYKRLGFSGLVVTDHLHPEYLSRIDLNHDWDAVMDHFLSGYKASKQRGDEIGLDVILGAELRFPENDNDYLVFGIDEAWLRSNPYMCCTSAQEFYDRFHDEVLILHAHPFRKGSERVQLSAIHGAEIINGNPRHENNNDLALKMCIEHPEFYRISGSDTHRPGDEGRAGVILPRRVKDSYGIKAMIEGLQYRLWSPEMQEFVDADEQIRSGGL